MYQELTQGSCFAFDKEGKYFVSNTAYLLTGGNLEYLLAILNSKLFEWAFKSCYSVSLGENGVRWLAQCIVKLPIPSRHLFDSQKVKERSFPSFDNILYDLLSLSAVERDFIESQ